MLQYFIAENDKLYSEQIRNKNFSLNMVTSECNSQLANKQGFHEAVDAEAHL